MHRPGAVPFVAVTVSRRPPRRIGAPAAGVIAGLALVLAVFMPWYATNVGPPFAPTSASGWDATAFARIALAMGLLIAGAAAAAVLDERRLITLCLLYTSDAA